MSKERRQLINHPTKRERQELRRQNNIERRAAFYKPNPLEWHALPLPRM